MSGATRIEWADRVWNPVTGCTKVSEGCDNCYAERMAKRLAGRCGYPKDAPFTVTQHSLRLLDGHAYRNPQRIFVCSMGDLFHDDVPESTIIEVLTTIAFYSTNTFMLLTKRPQRMRDILTRRTTAAAVWIGTGLPGEPEWPLPNLWIGVTAENQQRASERIPVLLDIPAAVRFVSCEPLIGSVSLNGLWKDTGPLEWDSWLKGIDWVIAGGETGPGARPMHPDWPKQLRDECVSEGVPFFFKQWGEWTPFYPQGRNLAHIQEAYRHGQTFYRVGKQQAGRELDLQIWEQLPKGKRHG